MQPSIQSNDDRKERLKHILQSKSFLHGDFILSSGEKSKVFFDVKMTSLDAEGAWLSADLLLDRISGKNIKAVGGLAVGACPIVSAMAVRAHDRRQKGEDLPSAFFYVRKQVKDHGTQKAIEGFDLKKGDRVVVVDDVATKGGAMLEAIVPLKEIGCEIVSTMVVVDRLQGAQERLQNEGYALEYIFTRDAFEK